MRVTVSSILARPADEVWSLVTRTSTLSYVARGLLGFAGSEAFPDEWREGDTVQTRLLLFGVFPTWRHTVEIRERDDVQYSLYTHESGGPVATWNHLIRVNTLNAGACHYTDRVDIEAGALTPLAVALARLLFRYRQWRWRRLLQTLSKAA